MTNHPNPIPQRVRETPMYTAENSTDKFLVYRVNKIHKFNRGKRVHKMSRVLCKKITMHISKRGSSTDLLEY
jgi:hypothetical protein